MRMCSLLAVVAAFAAIDGSAVPAMAYSSGTPRVQNGTDEVDAVDAMTSVPGGSVSACHAAAMIIATEVGDKSFFIAAVLAMRKSQTAVFLGAMAALAPMDALGSVVGASLPALLPIELTHWAAVALFVYFGVMLLSQAHKLFLEGAGFGPSEELQEVEAALDGKGVEESRHVAFRAFALIFLAEWGDRSQIATVLLAASKDPGGVLAGAVLGHCLCTGLAVIGGRLLAARISEAGIAASGGALFLAFALHAVVTGPGA